VEAEAADAAWMEAVAVAHTLMVHADIMSAITSSHSSNSSNSRNSSLQFSQDSNACMLQEMSNAL
jgi:hypothetical protein